VAPFQVKLPIVAAEPPRIVERRQVERRRVPVTVVHNPVQHGSYT